MSVVKSAERVLAILEYLRQAKPSTVGDISKGLNLPNSSTSVLLKSLVDLGYLDYSPSTRLFKPSFRVALLGESVEERPILHEGPLTEALRALHEKTGETVLVGLQNGAYVQYVHVLASTRKLMERLPIGKLRLMAYNPLGEALLALLDDKRIASIFRHNNANWPDPETRFSESALWDQIRLIRTNGYAEGPGRTWPNAVIFAIALRPNLDMPPISIAVGGLGNSILPQREAIVETLLDVVATFSRENHLPSR